MHNTPKPTGRCKHGMIQDQCGDCKHLPPYVENPPPDLIRNTNSNMPDENPPVTIGPTIIKEKENNMGLEKPKCIHCKDKPQHARGLCSHCWYLWRHGKIDHPILGAWKPADPNHSKIVKSMAKKADKIQTLTANLRNLSVISLLRTKLKECLPVVQTLDMLGMGAKAKEEIQAHLGDWVK
jgi:hypothetical protein